MTALDPGEMVTAIRIPVPPAGHGDAYEKLKRKVGDYATAAAAVILTMARGKVATCSIGLTNLSRDAAVGRGGREDRDRLGAGCGDREEGGGGGRGDRHARLGQSRAGGLSQEDGGRDDGAGPGSAPSRARSQSGRQPMAKIPAHPEGERQGSGGAGRAAHAADPLPARAAQSDRAPYRLRHQPLRRLHRRSQRQVGEVLHHVRRAGRRRATC